MTDEGTQQTPKFRLTIEVPEDSHSKLKAITAMKRVSISSVINELVNRYVDEHQHEIPGVKSA